MRDTPVASSRSAGGGRGSRGVRGAAAGAPEAAAARPRGTGTPRRPRSVPREGDRVYIRGKRPGAAAT
ncbi:hypothetical protein GCM10010363_03780 [Streptomyces omiyaensis]|nr:hypothetical protein GCM10010363_03780 [Streptomyces omiyaensis]